MASKIPEECLGISKEKKEGFFQNLKGYFEYSPNSKLCLDYAEAVMIDSVYQISIVEVISLLNSITPTMSDDIFLRF